MNINALNVAASRADWFSPRWFAVPRLFCGLMTGTSIDGVDAALVEFSADENRHHLRLLSHFTKPFPDGVENRLASLAQSKSTTTADVSLSNAGLAEIYADAVREACSRAGVAVQSLNGVGTHGQTIWHQPQPATFGGHAVRSTLQIGSPSALAQHLGVTVVGDFRTADVALGGQGAPLAPMFDYEFLRRKDENVVALNLGGIANITILAAGAAERDVIAFDTGPSNLLIDAATLKFFGKRYDAGGTIGLAGRVLPRFLDALKEEPYITQAPPKSTGRELFNAEYLERALQFTYFDAQPAEDVVRTATEFTAWSIAENIRRFALEVKFTNSLPTRIIASGGGIHNLCLMRALQRELPDAMLSTTDEVGIPADAKEAMFFAYFAYRTLGGLHSNMPSVTGASKEAVLGSICLG
jgi:anhydro-N-acetylmuramic acid kinase